ncbi:MAG: DUF4474 domain-containing protein [Ruminococcus sp.]|nr:DUF4474 domain-containing protein [Candidatus Copronaster equi]
MKIFKKVMAVVMILSIALGTFFSLQISSYAAENMLGDTNGDGSINSFDALMIVKYLIGTETFSESQKKAADVDGDGKVNTNDALYILEYTTGDINKLPASKDETGERIKLILDYWYDPASGQIINDSGAGLLGFAYDAKNGVFYATNNAWQRNFGYTELYDYAAPFGMITYDTSRIYFSYEDKEYMVQLWKGQYGMVLIGCEIGFYYREIGDTSLMDTKGRKIYRCASDEMLIKIKLDLYRNNVIMFSKPEQYSWWQTGFVPGQLEMLGYTPESTSKLKLYSTITFPSSGFMNAFVEGLKATTDIQHNATKQIRKCKYELGKTYFVNGANNSVTFTWQ